MKSKLIFGLIVLVCVIFGILLLQKGFHEIEIKKRGNIIIGEITAVPSFCLSKHNRLNVRVDGQDHKLPISSKECREGKYVVGQQVEVLWDKEKAKIMSTEHDPFLILIIGAIPFMIPVFLWYKFNKYLC